MIYLKPTAKGTGATIWGTFEELRNLYFAIDELCLWEYTEDNKGAVARIIDVFNYELRHAYQGSRKTKKITYLDDQSMRVYGFNYTWVELLFTTSCIRRKCAYSEVSKSQHGIFLLFEGELERALYQYDPRGAANIEFFIENTRVTTDKLWHYFNEITYHFISQPSGKKRFRSIPTMLEALNEYSPQHSYIEARINESRKELNCSLWEIEYLDLTDDIIW